MGLIAKHQEQKEAFLKACTLARRTAETFLKYSNRSLQYFSHPASQSTFRGPDGKVKVILEKLLTQENRVLDYWTSKKKRLDQNQQFCLFERSARQSLSWIKEEGDIYLKTHTNVGNTKEETQALLKEHTSFKEKAKETRERVKLLLQLADTLVETGHAHAPSIKTWVEEVDVTYKDFSTRMDKYRAQLEHTLGIPGSDRSLAFTPTSPTTSASMNLDSSDRLSDSSLESKLSKDSAYIGSSDAPSVHSSVLANNSNKTSSNSSLIKQISTSSTVSTGQSSSTDLKQLKQIKELTEEKRKSKRRKEFIMTELIETERSYVKDLETAVNCFLKPMQKAGEDRDKIPGPL